MLLFFPHAPPLPSSATAIMSSQGGVKSQKSSIIFCQRQLNHHRGDNADSGPSNLIQDVNGDVQRHDHLADSISRTLRSQSSPFPHDLTYDISRLQRSEWVDLAALASCAVSKLGKAKCVGISELGSNSWSSIPPIFYFFFLVLPKLSLLQRYDSGSCAGSG